MPRTLALLLTIVTLAAGAPVAHAETKTDQRLDESRRLDAREAHSDALRAPHGDDGRHRGVAHGLEDRLDDEGERARRGVRRARAAAPHRDEVLARDDGARARAASVDADPERGHGASLARRGR